MNHRTFKTSIDLKPEVREKVIGCCNEHLADATALFAIVKTAHFNCKGPNYIAIHKLLDDLADHLLDDADEVAERASQLGGYAHGQISEAARETRIPPIDNAATTTQEWIAVVANRYATYVKNARAHIDMAMEVNDQVTGDIFIDIARQGDKDLWFLEAHLQG